eukprot:CAMPEP_0180793716 /NCGR_PEP_ID=MMETSP1038_2-20121128/55174_1 /TAXON_ID=632150 /ORGANISM="Azadinium spinosum, Strain 3D9" /LENGTH=202 /DNA_ID=CAMNT_0022832307 /DNA_START=89 /DNA_END=697 /DNA_ORIENTATION=-
MPSCQVHVTALNLAGESLAEIEINPTCNVQALIDAILKKDDDVDLVFQGNALRENVTLVDERITAGSVTVCVIRKQGVEAFYGEWEYLRANCRGGNVMGQRITVTSSEIRCHAGNGFLGTSGERFSILTSSTRPELVMTAQWCWREYSGPLEVRIDHEGNLVLTEIMCEGNNFDRHNENMSHVWRRPNMHVLSSAKPDESQT